MYGDSVGMFTCCTTKPYIKASEHGLTWNNMTGCKLSPCGVSYHHAGLVITLRG